MPLGRALESASVNVLLNKLASQQFIDFFLKWKLDIGLLIKLETTLQVIYAVLDDAEEKQAENDPHVKNWLDKVRDAAYDAEDILEEIAIDALESRNKVPNFIQKDILRLRENTRGIVSGIEKRLTTPLVNEEHVFGSRIYGRDGDKEEMIKLLTSCEENSDEVCVIPIVGMGGLGKTTLAQIVYNDERVKKHFQLKAWACVSDEFDVMRITKALLESGTKRTCGMNNLELLQGKLRDMLNRRKFLLVLDDVWNEDYGDWDKLRIPLAVGSPEQIAFPHRNSDAFPGLKIIAEGVARKCKGLPLAAKSLGGLLRSNPEENYWKDILNSRIWDLSKQWHNSTPEQPEGGKEMEATARSYFFDLLSRLEDKAEVVKQSNIYEKARHFSYIRGDTDVYVKFKPLSKVKCLRTFLSLDPLHGFNIYCLTKKVPEDLLPELSSIKELPESTSTVYNLQTLLLKCRHLIKLPMDLKNLTNLRHLNIETSDLQMMPLEMGKLTSLQTLSNFVVGKDSGSGIGQLKSLSNLRGKLSISGLQNVVNVRDAIEAKLEDKEYLEKLVLEWIGIFDSTRDEKVENEILDMLQPHENLKNLSIEYYGGTEFPSWVGDPSFSMMEYLNLKGCKKCISLPSLGQLPLLKELIIEGMDGIKHVGPQFYGDDYSSIDPFQSLETLKKLRIELCEELAAFSRLPSPENLESEDFPHLRVLKLVRCPKLSKLPNYLPSLEGVWIDDCEKLAVLPKLVKLLNLELLGSNVEILGTMVDLSLSNQQLGLAHLASLRRLTISGCPKLVALPDEVNKMPPRLESLDIKDCHNLEKLPDELFKLESLILEGGIPITLKYMRISYCRSLKSLPVEMMNNDMSLEYLEIEACASLCPFQQASYPNLLSVLRLVFVGLPTNLISLEITHCEKLNPIDEWKLHKLTTLRTFSIGGIPGPVSFSNTYLLPDSITFLRILELPDLLSISEGLQNLTSLETVEF
ncbi:putative disease resistance RPP13-like protein 1 [Vitis vinifera]|uniref:Putative disease resistance RPP13-like protein 1 n=1 Tax=Vitis vinifera TaxID=29760 RepID=A0A438DYW0_VITVI|nr:putative disease resistance RPP13-like protein 1 [Vitis vinifera]